MAVTAPTWHNSARRGDFAKTVLMPGDPRRSAFIAQNFLTDARLVNDLRGVQGYTGFYEGRRVSVMASGMGIPAISIYARELFEAYGVESVIRVGTAGTPLSDVNVGDVVAAVSACTDSNVARALGYRFSVAPTADFSLLCRAKDAAKALEIPLRFGPVFSSDVLYTDTSDRASLQSLGIIAREMEAAGLYLAAMRAGARALCLLTVVEGANGEEEIAPETRETGLQNMIRIALHCAE